MTLQPFLDAISRALYPMPASLSEVEQEPWLDLARFQARERLAEHEARTEAELGSAVVGAAKVVGKRRVRRWRA